MKRKKPYRVPKQDRNLAEFLELQREKEKVLSKPPWITKYGKDWTVFKQLEAKIILHVAKECGWNRTHTAAVLGLTKETVQNKLAIYEARGMLVGPSSPINFRKPLTEEFWEELEIMCEV